MGIGVGTSRLLGLVHPRSQGVLLQTLGAVPGF